MAYKYLKEELILNEFQKSVVDYGMELQRLMWNSLVDNFNEKVNKKEIKINNKTTTPLENHIWDNFYNEIKQSYLSSRIVRAVSKNYIQAWKNCFNTNMPNHGEPVIHEGYEYGKSLQFVDNPNNISEKGEYQLSLWRSGGRFGKQKNPIKREQLRLKLRKYKCQNFIMGCEVKQSNIIKVGHRYFLNICYEYTVVKKENQSGEIGLDWGLVDYFIDSNGNKHNLPKRATRQLNRIKCLQRILSKKTKNSKNYIKVVNKITDAWIRYNNIVKDWTEKFTTKLCKENSLIVIEDLDLIGMRKNTHKSRRRQMNHNSFYRVKFKLEQKALLYSNCRVIRVDQYFPSSQLCSVCGENTGKKPVNVRKFTCPYCGTTHDRDTNAAINILKEGQRIKNIRPNG